MSQVIRNSHFEQSEKVLRVILGIVWFSRGFSLIKLYGRLKILQSYNTTLGCIRMTDREFKDAVRKSWVQSSGMYDRCPGHGIGNEDEKDARM